MRNAKKINFLTKGKILFFLAFGSILTILLQETLLENQYRQIEIFFSNLKKSIKNRDVSYEKLNECSIKNLKYIPEESILVIGHAYGNPDKHNNFIAPKVQSVIEKNLTKIDTIIFTGDVFFTPSISKWNKLRNLYPNLDIRIAPGNHDVMENEDNALRDIFKISPFYTEKYPYKELINGNKVIIDDSTTSLGFKINSKTIKLLKTYNEKDDVYLFRHHKPIRELKDISNNLSFQYVRELDNAKDLQIKIKNNITIISGNHGAFDFLPRLKCYQYKNLRFIANGIGQVDGDKILVISEGKLYSYKL